MSTQHLITHAYASDSGWVRVPRAPMTSARAAELRDQGFTMVRSRRGMFGVRELPLRWYVGRDAAPNPLVDEPASPIAKEQVDDQGEKLRRRVDGSITARSVDADEVVPAQARSTDEQSSQDAARALAELVSRGPAAA